MYTPGHETRRSSLHSWLGQRNCLESKQLSRSVNIRPPTNFHYLSFTCEIWINCKSPFNFEQVALLKWHLAIRTCSVVVKSNKKAIFATTIVGTRGISWWCTDRRRARLSGESRRNRARPRLRTLRGSGGWERTWQWWRRWRRWSGLCMSQCGATLTELAAPALAPGGYASRPGFCPIAVLASDATIISTRKQSKPNELERRVKEMESVGLENFKEWKGMFSKPQPSCFHPIW